MTQQPKSSSEVVAGQAIHDAQSRIHDLSTERREHPAWRMDPQMRLPEDATAIAGITQQLLEARADNRTALEQLAAAKLPKMVLPPNAWHGGENLA